MQKDPSNPTLNFMYNIVNEQKLINRNNQSVSSNKLFLQIKSFNKFNIKQVLKQENNKLKRFSQIITGWEEAEERKAQFYIVLQSKLITISSFIQVKKSKNIKE